MRWLQNISFSSSSSSSTAATPATSPRKHLQANNNSNNNTNNHDSNQRNQSRHNYLGFRIAGPKLMRQRELRLLSDQEVTPAKEVAAPLSRSPSTYDTPLSSSAPASRTTSSALAVPLPLPLPLPEGDGDQRLPSPNEVGHGKGLEDRDREKADGTPSNSSMFASRDARKRVEHIETRSPSKLLHQEVNRGDSSQDEFRVNVPVRSAPTSPFTSPVISPHRMSTGDLFPHYVVPTGNQVWSAPEMATLDVPGLPPPAFYDYTAFSSDNTPLHSPPNRSPQRKNRSQSGSASPIHHRLSLEISSSRPENSCPINVHPLPLPPGAAMASPSALIPQVTNKPEPLPMNCQWQKGKLIGRGTFGSVYVASNRETGALCAMKEVEIFPDDPKSAECIKQLEQEIKVLSQLKHPNIVQYYGSEIVEDKFYIYLEYVHPGSINKYARDHCGAITESVVRNFTRHILSGLAYLHSTKTIHRDIKGANLLVDASGVVKLADFGMSKHLSGQRADLSLKGSPYWMAPELMQAVMQKDNSSDLALAVDIWSLGCTIIEMFTGKAPWSEYEGAAAMFKVMRDTPPIPETLSPEGKDFLRCCFRRNPAERASASVLLEHRFVKSSPQSAASSFNGKKSMDIPLSPREQSEFKLDQLPVQQSLRSTKSVTPDSETAQRSHYKTSDLTMAPRYSPRSTLETLPSLSPPRSGQNTYHPNPSGTINVSINQESKKNQTFR
ncbi:PREDICTED: mitogen-activated protein kinase kinase kinase YODA isoform X1 [Theobroma cacao]|uniref:mitogen-activated protein kinase kinase kinase n=1 Tax=Theobroma cacao TaxID=3641 RepID=A0AB32VL63_THECC|nr:PREDICTED: mitogen-activated protein kinase kinase kinase YODA isoform X1 [Theobroma cacao]